MLNQVIYTRCLPCRILTEGGRVRASDGFGVFAFSQEIIDTLSKTELDLLMSYLSVKNAASETSAVGRINSYEYVRITDSVYGIIFEYLRPQSHTIRKNGKSHRGGTFIKQCLLGELKHYPYEWFGADVWNAYLVPENDYYLDDNPSAETPSLPPVEAKPSGGYITLDDIRAFISDGRQEALKNAVWYVIHEFSLPEEERRPLIIRDETENVELWIAAIERAFSVEAAGKITFTTNRTQIQNYNTRYLYYYVKENGAISPVKNNAGNMSRRVYNLLVGMDINDGFAKMLRTVENGYFEMLDGESKTISVKSDSSINRSFYTDAVLFGDDINDFCGIVLPELGQNGISVDLPELYDAYRYLLDSDNKSRKKDYEKILRYLGELEQAGLNNSHAFSDYLVTYGLVLYAEVKRADSANHFRLLMMLYRIARTVGRENEVVSLYRDYLKGLLCDIEQNQESVIYNSQVLGEFPSEFSEAVLKQFFDEETVVSCARQLNQLKPAVSKAVLMIFERSLSADSISYNELLGQRTGFSMFCICILRMSADREMTRACLIRLQSEERFFYSLVVTVSGYLAKTENNGFEEWWEMVIEAVDGNLRYICSKLIKSGSASDELIEKVLANRIKYRGGCESELTYIFRDFLAERKDEKTGLIFFYTWIEVSGEGDLLRIIDTARNIGISVYAQINIFNAVDRIIAMDKKSRELTELYKWGVTLGRNSVSYSFSEFAREIKKSKYYDTTAHLCANMLHRNLEFRPDIASGESFRTACQEISAYQSGELHLYMMCVFAFLGQEELERYIKCYMMLTLELSGGSETASTMLALTEAAAYKFLVPSRAENYVRSVQKCVVGVSGEVFAKYRTRKTLKQIAKADFSDALKARLRKILE